MLRKLFVAKASGVLATVSGHNVAVTDELVLVDQKPVHTDRAAGMSLVGADADLGAEAVAKSVGETGGCVPVHAGRIDFVHKPFRIGSVFGDDRIRMAGAISMDVSNRVIHAVDNLHIHDVV